MKAINMIKLRLERMRGMYKASKYNNERGIALIFTLVVTIILTTTLTILLANMTNTVAQVETVGEQVNAELMADAGKDYYEAFVINSINKRKMNSYVAQSQLKQLDSERSFEIKNPIKKNINKNEIEIEYTIVGKSGDAVYEEETTLIVKK